MSENLSNDAVIYAMLSINSEIAIQKDYLDSPELPTDERDYEEETLADLEQALMEFIELYKNRLKADKTLPSLDELLYSEL